MQMSTLRLYPPQGQDEGDQSDNESDEGGRTRAQGRLDPGREIVGAAVALATAARALNDVVATLPAGRHRQSSTSHLSLVSLAAGERRRRRGLLVPGWYLLVTALGASVLGGAMATLLLRGGGAQRAPQAISVPLVAPAAAPASAVAELPRAAAPAASSVAAGPPGAIPPVAMPEVPAAAEATPTLAGAALRVTLPTASASTLPRKAAAKRPARKVPPPDDDGVLEPSFR